MKNYNLNTTNKSVAGGLNELQGSVSSLNDLCVVLSDCGWMEDNEEWTVPQEAIARIKQIMSEGHTPLIFLESGGGERSASCSFMDENSSFILTWIYNDDLCIELHCTEVDYATGIGAQKEVLLHEF